MSKYLIVILLFVSRENYCQPLVTDGNNKRILEWDSSYQIETVRFFGLRDYVPVDYQYIVRKNQRIIAEYFRHDDSSYLYVEHDSIGREKQKGILKILYVVYSYDTLWMPDVEKDPGLKKGILKDTITANISYRKCGRWKELDNYGNLWKGEYNKGKREGIWEEGFYFYDPHMPAINAEFMYDNFRPLSKHIFENGNKIEKIKDTAFWPEIKGKWFATLTSIDSNTYLLSRNELGKIYFNFETTTLFTSIRPSSKPVMHSLEKYNAIWKQDGDLIIISEEGSTKILQVLSISNNQMIVRFLKWK